MKISRTANVLGVGSKQDSNTQKQIDRLNQRKQEINDMKQDYRETALKQGLSSKDIEAKMQEYDSMISDIDTQIAQLTAEQQKKVTTPDKPSPTINRDKNDFNNSNEQLLISDLSAAQRDMNSIKSIRHAQSILKTEELSYQPSFAFKGNVEKAAKINSQAERLNAQIGKTEKKTEKTAKHILVDNGDSNDTKSEAE
ncbi:MAG TPA: hypothetical protein VHO71_04195 [Caproiciproducens sp.]|nr:hypothetical protein [Caproiciproducens sp.]